MPSKSPKNSSKTKRNIKLVLEYDGSSFFGFQKQPHHPTIQETLEKALSEFFARKMKIAAASGRTDTGVHAENQVVNFHTPSDRSTKEIQKGLNALLPKPVVVKRAQVVPKSFHARFSARGKAYEYRIWNDAVRSPLAAKHAYHIPQKLDVKKMREAAKHFVGRHDFKSFTSEKARHRGKEGKTLTSIRTIRRLHIQKKGSQILIHVEADGFLYHMVRNLVGTLLEVGKGKFPPRKVPSVIQAKDRQFAHTTAPATGLTLLSVYY